MKFVGIDTIEEAEKLKNLQIKIDSDKYQENLKIMSFISMKLSVDEVF